MRKMQVQRYVYPIDLTEENEELEQICSILGVSKAEAIRDAVGYYYDYVKGLKVIETRKISRKQAEREILEYMKKHKNAWTSQIADDLSLDVVLVNSILEGLAEQGEIGER